MTREPGMALRTLITSAGRLELWLEDESSTPPGPGEVLVEIQAAPINPSDIHALFGPADLSTLTAAGTPERPRVTATVPEARLRLAANRLNVALPGGSEGAGTVVQAGPGAESALGATVAIRADGTYAQRRVVRLSDCIVMAPHTPPATAAAAFVNPLTALGMVETMRREGHTALVHTAAASNLGQMLNRLCLADDIGLVNIVRSSEQAALLREIGAEHIVDSTDPEFVAQLGDAIAQTGATLAFDAVGGGRLAATILTAMERAQADRVGAADRYGSPVHKQIYIYGSLDPRPTEIARTFGLAWGVGGWLLPWFLQRIGPQDTQRLGARVAAELTTTFRSSFAGELSLAAALEPESIAAYARRATGAKYLINPSL